jgi:hypothetical protein
MMRSVSRDSIGTFEAKFGKFPKNVKIDYGSVASVGATNTYINFTTPFTVNPIVLFSPNCAWNADPGCRLVGLTPSQATIVVATSGVLYWAAIGV